MKKYRISSTATTLARQHPKPMNLRFTPGEILLEEYLNPMGISQNAMARAVGVSPLVFRLQANKSSENAVDSP